MQTQFLPGNQHVVILCHAYTGTPKDVVHLGKSINALGYSVLMPLLYGHGEQEFLNVLNYSIHQWKAQINNYVQQLKNKGYQKIAIFGLSMGGMLALDMLTGQEALIGGGSFNSPVPIRDATRVKDYFFKTAKKSGYLSMNQKIIDEVTIQNKVKKHFEEMTEYTVALAQRLKTIKVPVYIAQSGQDELIDTDTGLLIKKQLINTTVDYNYFEDGTHVITYGKSKDAFTTSVIQFIESLNW